MLRCAVFASGGGSNFQALLDRKQSGDLHVDFVLFVGNNSKAVAFERARKNNIPCIHLAPSHFPSEEEYSRELLGCLGKYNVELIILAGYMKKFPSDVVVRYRNRIVNIYPGLLPSFCGKQMYGIRVHEAAIEHGVKVTGVTVHFVDEEYDHGPIILQEPVRVLDNDDAHTLAERVLKVEHASYWRAIEAIARGTLRVEGHRVTGDV